MKRPTPPSAALRTMSGMHLKMPPSLQRPTHVCSIPTSALVIE